MSGTTNKSEWLFLMGLILVGTPFFVYLGASHGYQTAAKLYGGLQAPSAVEEENHQGVSDAPEPFTADNVAQGQSLYMQYCVACHGAQGDGRGPAASAMVPPPRDFTNVKVSWTLGSEPENIFQSISQGTPGTAMMGFAGALSVSQRWQLVRYLQAVRGENPGGEKIHPETGK